MIGIGDKIKQRRKELEMSQDELAKRLGYKSRSSINKIELGFTDVSQPMVAVIANALDTSIAYLMDMEQKNPATKIDDGISPERRSLINLLNSLSPDDAVRAEGYLQALIDAHKQ
jgi:transcriptional regulator with XRE-family HTH domain